MKNKYRPNHYWIVRPRVSSLVIFLFLVGLTMLASLFELTNKASVGLIIAGVVLSSGYNWEQRLEKKINLKALL